MRHFETDGTEYVDQIRMIETTDPGHADVLNQLFQSLVNNDMFLKNLSQTILEQIKNVDNTHDIDKPVSVPVQEALDAYYAQLTAYADKSIADLINGAPTTLDTLKELADAIKKNQDIQAALDAAIGTKANQKEFDSHVSTTASSTALGHVKVDSALSGTSTNPVQNKAVNAALENKLDVTGDSKNNIVTFSDATQRTNITSGEKLSVMLGKIKKFFTDLKTVAFTGSYADLSNKPSIPTYSASDQLSLSGTAFKLKDYCTTVTDWNATTTNGWYMGFNAANAPISGEVWFYGIVIAHDEKFCRQILFRFAWNNNVSDPVTGRYERIKHNGSWGTWTNTSVHKAVPDDAVFTDTKYSNMAAATASAAGKAGLVPAPAAGAQGEFLRGDGTWQNPTDELKDSFQKSSGEYASQNGYYGINITQRTSYKLGIDIKNFIITSKKAIPAWTEVLSGTTGDIIAVTHVPSDIGNYKIRITIYSSNSYSINSLGTEIPAGVVFRANLAYALEN